MPCFRLFLQNLFFCSCSPLSLNLSTTTRSYTPPYYLFLCLLTLATLPLVPINHYKVPFLYPSILSFLVFMNFSYSSIGSYLQLCFTSFLSSYFLRFIHYKQLSFHWFLSLAILPQLTSFPFFRFIHYTQPSLHWFLSLAVYSTLAYFLPIFLDILISKQTLHNWFFSPTNLPCSLPILFSLHAEVKGVHRGDMGEVPHPTPVKDGPPRTIELRDKRLFKSET